MEEIETQAFTRMGKRMEEIETIVFDARTRTCAHIHAHVTCPSDKPRFMERIHTRTYAHAEFVHQKFLQIQHRQIRTAHFRACCMRR